MLIGISGHSSCIALRTGSPAPAATAWSVVCLLRYQQLDQHFIVNKTAARRYPARSRRNSASLLPRQQPDPENGVLAALAENPNVPRAACR